MKIRCASPIFLFALFAIVIADIKCFYNGEEYENNAEVNSKDGKFVYRCEVKGMAWSLKPIACVFNGKKVEPGEFYVTNGYNHSCYKSGSVIRYKIGPVKEAEEEDDEDEDGEE